MRPDIFLLCGLGADERLFHYLDLSQFNVIPIQWLEPNRNESMSDYAKRLLPQITSVEPILMGVSFGGMMAIEIGKLIQAKKIILISSSATQREIPRLYRLAGRFRIHRLVPGALLKRAHIILNWVMGATDPVRRNLLKDMLQKTDATFLYWAIDKVVRWQNAQVPPNVIRIHGTNDKVLPYTGADCTVAGRGHLIVANKADEINFFLKNLFATPEINK